MKLIKLVVKINLILVYIKTKNVIELMVMVVVRIGFIERHHLSLQ